MDEGTLRLAQAKRRMELEAELRELSNQVAALGRSLEQERGRVLLEGGALRAMEMAVGGAKARVGGACRARDRAWERLRQQLEAGRDLWAELEAARKAREGAELRRKEAESRCKDMEEEIRSMRKAVAAANHARQRAEQERDEMSGHVTPPATTTGDRDPIGLQEALVELRGHNRELMELLQQRHEEAQKLQRDLMAVKEQNRAAMEARVRLEWEQKGLQGRMQRPWAPLNTTEAALRARCCHLQDMLQREAGSRAALQRDGRAVARRLGALLAELEEQRIMGERYRRQAESSEAAGGAVLSQLAEVAAGTTRMLSMGQRLRRALDDVGDGAAAAACHVAALRVRLRCDPLTLTRTVRRIMRGEDEDSA